MRVAVMNNQWAELIRAIPTLGRYSLRADVQAYIRAELCHEEYKTWPLFMSFKYWYRCKSKHPDVYLYKILLQYTIDTVLVVGAEYCTGFWRIYGIENSNPDLWMGVFHSNSASVREFKTALSTYLVGLSILLPEYTLAQSRKDALVLTQRGEYELKSPYDLSTKFIFQLGSSGPQ